MLSPGDRIGDWIVEKALGEGGMGAVYQCRNVLSARIKAAVKVLKPDGPEHARERFVREVDLLATVKHPSVVEVLGGGEDESRGLLFLAMELIDGEELTARLARGPLTWDEAARIFRQLGAGLLAAHNAGVVHRDIKPQNIMLCADGTAKLLDFGIAAEVHGTKLTKEGHIPGTVSYMAPEVFRGQRPDHRADIYSLGLLLWECLTGAEAYPNDPTTTQQENVVRIMSQKLAAQPFDLGPQFSQNARDLVTRCTDPEPSRRLDELHAFVKVLEGTTDPTIDLVLFGDERLTTAEIPDEEEGDDPSEPDGIEVDTPTPLPPRDADSEQRRTLMIGAAMGGAVVLIIGIAALGGAGATMLMRPTPPPPEPPAPAVIAPAPAPAPAAKAKAKAEPSKMIPPSWQMPPAEIPEGFPFEVPEGAELYTGMKTESGTSTTYVVSFFTRSDPVKLCDRYAKTFEDKGLTVNRTQTTQSNGTTRTVVGWGPKGSATFSIMPYQGMTAMMGSLSWTPPAR